MFSFSPLQGALSQSTASQSLLELDGGVKVLIDVGWDESFDTDQLKELEKQVPTISLILLTQATVSHLAAYAHCCKNFPRFARIPIFATRPVIDLGRTLLQDIYASTPLAATTIPHSSLVENSYYPQPLSDDQSFLRQAPVPEEIAKYFSLIQELKYSQPHQPVSLPNAPPLNGLTITAYNSGRTLGGTIWHIQHGLETIVYGVDWGQYKENVFSGAAWIGHGGGSEVIEQLRKPTALICSSRSPDVLRPGPRDEQLLAKIKSCTDNGGTVLIPIDSSARVLELAYVVEHAWRQAAKEGGSKAKLYLAGRSVGSLVRNVRTLLEWTNESIVREFETVAEKSRKTNGADDDGQTKDGAGPFQFKHLRLLERKAQVEKMLTMDQNDESPVGKVILASDTSLGWGFSKDVLQSIAQDPKNLVILTEVPGTSSQADKPSIARTLWDWWTARDESADGDQIQGGGRELEFCDAKKQALEGTELTLYQQWLATQRQLQATLQTGGSTSLEGLADIADDVSSDSSDDSESDDEQQGRALNISTTIGQASRKKVVLKDEDLGINILIKKRGHHDFDVREKRGREKMFPIMVHRKRNDEFGELIRPEEYLREEEREEEANENAGGRDNEQGGLGKKRKWDDVGTNAKNNSASNKRPQPNRLASTDDAPMSEAADGPVHDDGLDAVDDEAAEEEAILGPSKLIITKTKIPVNLSITYIDFSGLHTARNLEMLLPLVQPRKLVLIGGSPAETSAVADRYKTIVAQSRGADVSPDDIDVLTPSVGAAVDASVDTNAWVVKLADTLVKRLQWQTLRSLGIVTVTGQLMPGIEQAVAAIAAANEEQKAIEDEDGANKRLKTESGEHADSTPAPSKALSPLPPPNPLDALPTLDILPTSHRQAAALASASRPLHVGELRLADLRRTMQSAGHTAEFRGEGTLVVDGSVAVRKAAGGRVELESVGLGTDGGPAVQMGGTFYKVKRVIYEGLAVVAGG